MLSREPIPGLHIGDDPALNLTWLCVGYDILRRSYGGPELNFPNALKEATRVKASRVWENLRTLLGLRVIRSSSTGIGLVEQLVALTGEWANGVLVYGPLLGFAYVSGHAFYMHLPENPHMESFPMPRSPGVQEGAQYDHYIHIEVALNSLRGLLEKFGCWADMDVRPSTALPVQTSYEEANLALMQLQFNRLGIHNFACLDGCTAAFRQPEFLQPRQYVAIAQEALPQGVEKFFFHGEGMSYWQQARLQFLWVFALGETGELCLYKIAGHLDDQRQFHPNPRPERRAITYTALDGAPRSLCKNHYQNSNVTRAETPCRLPGWTLINGVFVDDYGHQRALVMFLQKPPTVTGRNMQHLHLVKLSQVSAELRAVLDLHPAPPAGPW